MRTLSFTAIAVLATVTLFGCGSASQSMQSADAGAIPDWFTSIPKDPAVFYAANTQVSQDLQLAIDKATQGARTEISRMVETKITGLQARFTEETGTANNAQLLDMFTQANKSVVASSLAGSRVSKQKQMKDGNNWRAYVLVEYPTGAASAALAQRIKANDDLYTRFRASQTFKELDDEVKKYEESKKQ